MEVVPNEVRFAAAKLDGFNRNRFRIEPQGATSAGPASIVTFQLPENALIDLRSFRVHMDATTTLASSGGTDVYGKLPPDASTSLISNFEIFLGGVQIEQGASEYNSICRMLKLACATTGRNNSVDRMLFHSEVDTSDAVDDKSLIFQPPIGFFAESSTRLIPTSLTGAITVRITFAPASVLAYKERTVAISNNLSANALAAAPTCTYSVSNLHCTIDTLQMGDAYERMLLDRLSQEDFLPVNYKSYYSFVNANQTGSAHTVRFSVSSSSVNAIFAGMRSANHTTAGVRTRQYVNAATNRTDPNCSNALYFRAFNNETKKRGNMRYTFTVNNVRYPQFDGDILNAAADLSLYTNQVHKHDAGHMVTSLDEYQNGKCVIPLILNLPGQALNIRSGFNSRGAQTNMEFEVKGLTPLTPDANSQTVGEISTFIAVQTTAQLRIAGSRQVATDH